MCNLPIRLFEVLDAVFKELLVLLSVDVLGDVRGDDPLAVAHLAEDPAVGGGDALDRHHRRVGVEVDVVGRAAFEIDVLGRDLAVFSHLTHQLGRRDKPAFAVGDRDRVVVADFGAVEPGRFVGGDPGLDHHRLVAADRVEGQGRGVALHVDDLAEGDEAQLYKCLEAVADAQHQAVPFF